MSSLGVRRRFAAVSLALAGSLIALSACSGAEDPDADAAQSPSGSVSPSTSPSPTPTPSATYKPASADGPAENVPLPVMPEEAKVESKEGLIAFARYWYELVNYGYETGDVEPVRAVSGPDCTDCNRYFDVVQRGYRDEDWMAGAMIDFRSVHSDYVLTPDGLYQVLIQFTQEPIEFFGPEGAEYGVDPGSDAPVVQILEARFQDEKWVVAQLSSM
ncbi:DUF6318 family protein [Arthrobacter sp. BL-252-APC-1A]|uniref:DUF6318 family protein n=1 Tax=Arthrobacter sp. BL-252-APC-1A TaxID=2606622 RepID=UPI00227B4B9F|nr:DUF6318 family protein [Arthrobacter sp. BL-252-APC-1A]